MKKNELHTIFTQFAENEAKGHSPLYEYWCYRIAQDDLLLDLVRHIPPTQPKPNHFFASVQYLALKSNLPLAHCFLHPEETEYDTSFQLLKEFCIDFKYELIQLFTTKRVQTNEVQRAAYLYPIFYSIFQRCKKPLTLIEIGTSAGLLLNLDHYKYRIQQEPVIHFGDRESPLQIHSANLGESLVEVGMPDIKNRLGIDLNIIDLSNEDDYYWLQCLIWPEQNIRKENVRQARDIHIHCEKTLWAGDFRKLIPPYVEELADDTQIVLFHTHVANQFPLALKEDLVKMVTALSSKVPIYHVYNNLYDRDLHVDFIQSCETTSLQVLKNPDGHGHHFYWRS